MDSVFQRLESHMTFICPECGENFEQQQQWRLHLNFHHDYLCKTPEDFGFIEINDRYHECLQCNQIVADGKRAIALLQYHRFMHLPHKSTYKCRHCSGTFMRKRICFTHLCRSHKDVVGEKLALAALKTPMLSVNKKESPIKFPDTSSIARHNPEFYLRCICPQCGYEVSTCSDWLKHIELSHRQSVRQDNALQKIAMTDSFVCSICESVIYGNDKEKHQRHYFMHLPHKLLFRCAYCKIKRPFKTEIMHHFMTTHLLVFEKQRLFMRKPKEFGCEVGRKLDRELDLLLKYGNNVGAPQGSSWSKPILNSNRQRINQQICTVPVTKKNSIERKNDVTSLANVPSESISKVSNIKKDLDALCAEIFKDIDDDETAATKNNEPTNVELLTDDYVMQDGINSEIYNEEEIISIEIDALDENELCEMNKCEQISRRSSDSQPFEAMPEIYANLKALYNAKVLHLCPQCGISFAEQSYWREHVLKTHENLYKLVEQSFKLLDDQQSNLCLTCQVVLQTTTRTELQRHLFSHMPYSAYLKCSLCEKCEISKPQMLEHLENNHGSFLKSINDNYKILEVNQNVDSKKIAGHNEEFTKVKYTFETTAENIDCLSLMIHLQNARDRLNGIAAECNIVQV